MKEKNSKYNHKNNNSQNNMYIFQNKTTKNSKTTCTKHSVNVTEKKQYLVLQNPVTLHNNRAPMKKIQKKPGDSCQCEEQQQKNLKLQISMNSNSNRTVVCSSYSTSFSFPVFSVNYYCYCY